MGARAESRQASLKLFAAGPHPPLPGSEGGSAASAHSGR